MWTSTRTRGARVAGRIACGTVNVNEGFAATFGSIDAPMGGMKHSGLGRRQGRDGIRRFVEVQSVATQSGPPDRTEPRPHPGGLHPRHDDGDARACEDRPRLTGPRLPGAGGPPPSSGPFHDWVPGCSRDKAGQLAIES